MRVCSSSAGIASQHLVHARTYVPMLGRFTRPDPANSFSLFNPQSFNRYAYALSNPVNLVDRTGLWPAKIHNEIINQAFPGLSPLQRSAMKDASAFADAWWADGQRTAASFKHGMRAPGQSREEAAALGKSYIVKVSSDAQRSQTAFEARIGRSAPLTYDALWVLGLALHLAADSVSPSHEGGQQWDMSSISAVRDHLQGEATITPQRMEAAVAALRAIFKETFGAEAAAAAEGAGTSQPCRYDDSSCKARQEYERRTRGDGQ